MFENLKVFQMSHAMAQHAAARQTVVAANIANADTPGYKARTVASFTETYQSDATSAISNAQRATRPAHLHGQMETMQPEVRLAPDQGTTSPNGNSVSLETEMLNAVDIKREHDRALMIYKGGLDVLRASLGRR